MKKLLLALLLLSNYTYSQKGFDGKPIFSIQAGVAQGNNEINFVDQNNYDVKSLYDNQISFIELSISATNFKSFNDSSLFKTAGGVSFKYFYPVHSTDSISTKYSGYLFGMDMLGINFFPRAKWIDFVISGGVNIGSKKVRIDRDVKYKNWIFAPKATTELRFIISQKIIISAKAEAQYDITKARFKLKKGTDVLKNLEGFKYNPVMISAGIGWYL